MEGEPEREREPFRSFIDVLAISAFTFISENKKGKKKSLFLYRFRSTNTEGDSDPLEKNPILYIMSLKPPLVKKSVGVEIRKQAGNLIGPGAAQPISELGGRALHQSRTAEASQ